MKLFKVNGDFREPRCISGLGSVAKLGFSFVAIATKEKQLKSNGINMLLADFQFDFKQLLNFLETKQGTHC
jgi:hypothetical protein